MKVIIEGSAGLTHNLASIISEALTAYGFVIDASGSTGYNTRPFLSGAGEVVKLETVSK